jgi:hypothetical protein
VKERIRGDRRERSRFEVVGTLPGTLETWHRHPVRNLGTGGALIESPGPLSPGTRIAGRLLLMGSQRDVKADVRYALQDRKNAAARYLIGLAWADGTRPVDDVLSVMFPPHRSAPGETERRRSPRTSAATGTEVNRAEWVTVKVLDISISGVLFLSPQQAAVGQVGQLKLRLGGNSFAGDIEVRRVDRHQVSSGGFRIAAAFTSLADGSRVSLEDFIGLADR